MLSDDRKFVKVIRAEDWNASRLTDEEVQQFEPFCAPRSVARRKFRGKWILSHLPEFENFTVPDLFPGKLLEAIQEVTGTTLIVTHDRSMVWIGADTEREVAIAKKKLTTLTNCWVRLALRPKYADQFHVDHLLGTWKNFQGCTFLFP